MAQQDPLQIALEHYRGGRLTQAERGYREILVRDPNDADALHWLGVLLHQAGVNDEAAAMLRRAAAGSPEDAAVQHNLGLALRAAGQLDEAVYALELSAGLEPARAQTWVALSRAYRARGGEDDANAAVRALLHARAVGLDSGDLHHELGLAWLGAGKADEAIASLRAALERTPNDPAVCEHLALAHRARGDAKDVRKWLNKALENDATRATAWYALGVLDGEAGNLAQAEASLRKAIRLKVDFAAAYRELGRLLERQGKLIEARDTFEIAMRVARGELSPRASRAASKIASVAELEQRIAGDPATRQLHAALSSATNLVPPAQMPPHAVATLFDRYAESFDEHLRERLEYHVPELLVAALAAATERGAQMDILDLGCGTGLCGPLLRPMARTLDGVDLSPAMIEKAHERGVYDHLEVSDLVDVLKRSPRVYHLLIAADVLNYVGDLAPVLEAAAIAMRPGGTFAFTVEAGSGERFELQRETQRFAHSKAYVEHIAKIFGFEERSLTEAVIRMEAGQPVRGFVVVLSTSRG